jgi:hypothetical protein
VVQRVDLGSQRFGAGHDLPEARLEAWSRPEAFVDLVWHGASPPW